MLPPAFSWASTVVVRGAVVWLLTEMEPRLGAAVVHGEKASE
jgi:hypothetical protein